MLRQRCFVLAQMNSPRASPKLEKSFLRLSIKDSEQVWTLSPDLEEALARQEPFADDLARLTRYMSPTQPTLPNDT